METFLRIDINIVAMVMLAIVVFIAYGRLDRQDSMNKTFLNISIIILIELLLETSTCIINKSTIEWLIPISILFHLILYLIAPILTYHWYLLIRKLIFLKNDTRNSKEFLMLLPIVINFIITIISPKYHLVFYINSNNVYLRGSWFYVSIGIIYFYIVYGLIIIVKNRRIIVKQEFIPLIIFAGLPIVGGIVQSLFYGPLLMWSGSAFSLIIVYIFLQQRMVHLDDLTGAWDRKSFCSYISQRLKSESNQSFGIIYVDIDGLKEINDAYGHVEGDFAIKTSILLIKSKLHKSNIVVRLGGDEFAILINCISKGVLDDTIDKIQSAFRCYNETSKKEYLIDCSFGADMFSEKFSDLDQFLDHVDSLMYRNKKSKKLVST